MNKHLFCFGAGYVATELQKILPSKWKISGTHRDIKKLEANQYLFEDINNSILDDVTHILISIPPNEKGDIVYLRFLDYLKRLKKLQWIGYLSSTSVYGDHQGNWVTEDSITSPNDTLGKNRLIAETQWLESNLPVNILRLAGIYGKDRSVFDSIKLGRAIAIYKENHFFSRIYIKDLVEIIKQIILSPKIGEVYNIADDLPAPHYEVINFAHQLLKQESPKLIDFQEAELSETMKHYYNSSKKIDNSKIKQFYNFKLSFPSYKEGLQDII